MRAARARKAAATSARASFDRASLLRGTGFRVAEQSGKIARLEWDAMKLPEKLANAIEREIAAVEAKALGRGAKELSRNYFAGRPQGLLNSRAAQAAYLVTRLPATFAAARAMMQEVAARVRFSVTSLLDLGAGVGTASWAA